jgi:CubicO group peptidase (beta-lactamase class C family)
LTGKTWENNIHERIFQPLGMSNSSTDMKSFQQGNDIASLHQMKNGNVTALPLDWQYMDLPYRNGPAGGINSNVIDMANWLRLQMNNGSFEGKQLITENSTRYMHSPKTIESPIAKEHNMYYCQGWMYEEYKPHPIIWHTGRSFGHYAMVAFMPQDKVGIVVLSNYRDQQLPKALAFQFFDLYFGNPGKDWSAVYLDAMQKAEEEANASAPRPPASPTPPREIRGQLQQRRLRPDHCYCK